MLKVTLQDLRRDEVAAEAAAAAVGAVINLLHQMRDAIIVVTAHVGALAITWDQ